MRMLELSPLWNIALNAVLFYPFSAARVRNSRAYLAALLDPCFTPSSLSLTSFPSSAWLKTRHNRLRNHSQLVMFSPPFSQISVAQVRAWLMRNLVTWTIFCSSEKFPRDVKYSRHCSRNPRQRDGSPLYFSSLAMVGVSWRCRSAAPVGSSVS